MQETQEGVLCLDRVWSLGWEDSLEEGIATHYSILAWKIPQTEKPGRLQSMGSQRVRHDWAGSHTQRKENAFLDLLQLVKMDNPWRWDTKVNQGLEGTETQVSYDWDGGIFCLWVTDVQDPSLTSSVSPRVSESTWTPGFSWFRFIFLSHWYVHSMYYNSVSHAQKEYLKLSFMIWETIVEKYDWPWYIRIFRRFKWLLSALRSNTSLWQPWNM